MKTIELTPAQEIIIVAALKNYKTDVIFNEVLDGDDTLEMLQEISLIMHKLN